MTIIVEAVNRKRRSRSRGSGRRKDSFWKKAKAVDEKIREAKALDERLGELIRENRRTIDKLESDCAAISSSLGNCSKDYAEMTRSSEIIASIEQAKEVGDHAKEAILVDSLRDWVARLKETRKLRNEGVEAVGGSDSSTCTFASRSQRSFTDILL